MKNNKVAKLFSIIMLILIIVIMCISNVYAMDDFFSDGDDFIEAGEANNSTIINTATMNYTLDDLYNTLLVIGIVVATVIGLVLGIQFITGSVEQKGKIKESLIPYVAGCIVIFGAFGIWRLVIIILR